MWPDERQRVADDILQFYQVKSSRGHGQVVHAIVEPQSHLACVRISLSIDLINNFKHLNFKSYLDNDYDSDTLVIQNE